MSNFFGKKIVYLRHYFNIVKLYTYDIILTLSNLNNAAVLDSVQLMHLSLNVSVDFDLVFLTNIWNV